MIMDALLSLLAAIEDNGGLQDVKTTDGSISQLKLVCDKQTYDVITEKLMGLINPISEIKSRGLCFTIEIGDLN